MERRIDFKGRLDGRTVLGDGSVRFNARLTRTGVFDYGDHKELRLPEEVFKQASVDSFKGITVTEGHKDFVDGGNWNALAVGHVGDDVKQDGDFLVASLVVKDEKTLAKIDNGELVELSMGYSVNLDAKPGEHEGEKYDAIQRDIVGNHAALGPANWGRAGSNVKLLDGAAYADGIMPESVKRIDAPADDNTRKDLDAARADNETLRKERDQARADVATEKKRGDTLEAERDAAKADASKARKDADDAVKAADARIDARVSLLDSARGVLGVEAKFDGKSEREIRLAVIAKVDPAFKADGKSDDYVAARFDLAIDSVKSERKDLGNTNTTTTTPGTNQPAKSRLDEAQEKADEEAKKSRQAGPPVGALVRK